MKINKNNYCVIMAGGIGSRFWPMSREATPKQFIDILGTGETLIQKTFQRFKNICPRENILIVTNKIYKDQILEQLPEIHANQILCEPTRRNTAPCIAYANYRIQAENPDANIIVAPSDHIVLNEKEFENTILIALEAAKQNNWLLTLGIKPNRPDTGYGYIQFNGEIIQKKDESLRRVKTFTEKPNLELAKSFLQSGDFLWNSGIFIWSLKSIMTAFKQYLPEVDNVFNEGVSKYNTEEEDNFIKQAYSVCKSISIDYGIMEKANNVYVLISDFGWSDLGTWGSLYDFREKNEKMNTIVGNNVITYDTKNCIVNMPSGKLAVIQGLDDYIVVENDNILLICKKSEEQQIRQIVNDVKIEKGEKFI